MFKSVAIFMACLIVVGCATPTAEIMDSWDGSHVSRVISSWGPPQRVTGDGRGGEIYIWSDDVSIPLSDGKTKTTSTVDYDPYRERFTVRSTTKYKEPVVLEGERVRMFWVDEDGIIYDWRAEGFVVDESDTTMLVLLGVGCLVGLIVLKSMQPSYDYKLAR